MSVFKLIRISLLELDEATGLHEKEHFVYSFFEADRLIEQISEKSVDQATYVLKFQIDYLEARHKRNYRGVFRCGAKGTSLSLQKHIQAFLKAGENRLKEIGMSRTDFDVLIARMQGLFEACVLEEMFKINHKPSFLTK